VLYSGDDFTLTSSGLVTIETTIGNSNKELWPLVKPQKAVLEGIRATVANRLARCVLLLLCGSANIIMNLINKCAKVLKKSL